MFRESERERRKKETERLRDREGDRQTYRIFVQ